MKHLAPLIFLALFSTACSTTKKATENTDKNSSPVKEQRVKDGADFRASGNEPFWSLDIDFQGSMHYITAEGYEFTVPAVKGERAMDANVTRYHATTEKGSLTVQVFNQVCEDSMSGKKNNFKIQVEIKKAGDQEAQTVTGCGNYIGTYELNDIWTLQSIGGKAVKTSNEQSKSPNLELRLNEERAFGQGGCNRFSGSFKLADGTITFGSMMSTKMACPEMNLESQYLSALSEKALPYTVVDGVLTIGSGDSKLVFKRGN